MKRQPLGAAGAAIALLLLLLPPARQWFEASMLRHMLLQAPLLMSCGALLVPALPQRVGRRLAHWNAHGITGLFAVALGTALLMVPRLLDLAVADFAIDAGKTAGLMACGFSLRLSWRPAGALVQGFFLGNVLPMMAAVGQLYQDSPLRLCNAYLLDDQVRLGQGLVIACISIGVAWFTALAVRLARSESPEGMHPKGFADGASG